MKRSSKILSALLLLFAVCCSFTVIAQSTAPSEIYEAEGRHCDDCKGSGRTFCSVCKGEDLTKQTCLTCSGQDWTLQTCLTCKGEDWMKQVCLTCKGEDWTQQTCRTCSGRDWTQMACSTCGGSGVTRNGTCYSCHGSGKRSACYSCYGRGKRSACYTCYGRGKRSACYTCYGRGKRSACYTCYGNGKRSACYSCYGKSSPTGTICKTCVGAGTIEVLVAKHNSLDDLRKRINSQLGSSPTAPRAPPTSTISDVLTAADGSYFGELSKETGRPKTVFVNGYTRKDGTFVKSHFRSLPSSQVVSREPALQVSPGVAENGSYYGELNQYGVPKTVHVGGYYRKDGTYVRGHYRSAPRRR